MFLHESEHELGLRPIHKDAFHGYAIRSLEQDIHKFLVPKVEHQINSDICKLI
jgi:hypothetical protein